MRNENLLKLIDAVERHNAKDCFYVLSIKYFRSNNVWVEATVNGKIVASDIIKDDLSNASRFRLEIDTVGGADGREKGQGLPGDLGPPGDGEHPAGPVGLDGFLQPMIKNNQ